MPQHRWPDAVLVRRLWILGAAMAVALCLSFTDCNLELLPSVVILLFRTVSRCRDGPLRLQEFVAPEASSYYSSWISILNDYSMPRPLMVRCCGRTPTPKLVPKQCLISLSFNRRQAPDGWATEGVGDTSRAQAGSGQRFECLCSKAGNLNRDSRQ